MNDAATGEVAGPEVEPDLAAAQAGDPSAFDRLMARHRRGLLAHGYRMLGSFADAEDALQETLLGAWRGLAGFEGRASLRGWLYRIHTHTCLRLGAARGPRMLTPDTHPPRRDPDDLGEIAAGPWLEPWPDDGAGLGGRADPAAVYERREDLELAFVAALQHLPGNQRAVLILRDVLQFSAAETAELLETSLPAVNSALQRAKATVLARVPARSQQVERAALGDGGQRALVERFVAAWESADLPAMLGLLTRDVRFTMPPLPAWFDGADAVAGFLRARIFASAWRLFPIAINGQLGFACYMRAPGAAVFQLAAVNAVTLRGNQIAEITGFLDPAVMRRFVVADELPDAG